MLDKSSFFFYLRLFWKINRFNNYLTKKIKKQQIKRFVDMNS